MSGDVQPRRRKDKKKKKDDLGVEEPRGTAAALGEGDVFMHSHNDHGTGGHWCAKIIFFSLLAVLITLIGLIILENRGLTELEANSVESRYSGVLEGWLEDTPDDDHHDEHTLELKHPENQEEDGDPDDDDDEEEIEKIERELSDDDIGSKEVPLKSSLHESDEDVSKEDAAQEEAEDDEDFLEADDDEPPVEHITTPPAGRPFVEIEEETIVKPVDTLAEEEEYERNQEELRREEAQASHMWLKLAVGGALLAATHVVLRRATTRADVPEPEEPTREDTASVPDRRMTLISEEPSTNVAQRQPQPAPRPVTEEEIFKKPAPVMKSAPISKQDIEREVNEKKTLRDDEISEANAKKEEEKELYSDDEEIEEEEEEEEDIVIPTKIITQQKSPVLKTEHKEEESEPEEVPDDVEIIDEEQIEEEEEEEEEQDEDEEEISDVDDTELLSRLEAKYGRIPEPERPGKQKGGGNSIEDEWPGEPSDSYWREQLDIAEEEIRQDWLD